MSSTAKVHAKQLHRHLGLWSVVSISVGAMMGSGIFVLPLLAAEVAGPWVALSYVLAGFIVLPAMLSKAELATAMPVSGGTYVYLDRSMGPWMGTIGGLGTWLALSAKTAFALVGLGAYLVIFSSFPPVLFSLLVLAALVALNILGAGKASTLQVIVVVGSAASLVVFAMFGISAAEWVNLTPAFPEGGTGILAGAGFVFVSYNGVTKVCSVAEEIVEPERNIPLGMAISLVGVMALYALIAMVVTGNVDYTQTHHDVTPIATAAKAIFGETGALVMSAVAVAGLISMCNAGVLATARFPFAMSRDGLMPGFLARIHTKTGTPAWAIGFTALLLVLLVTALPVYSLAKLASGFTIFIFCVVNAAVVVLRETSPAWYRPTFKSPWYPWTQLLGMLGCMAVLISLGWFPMMGIALAIFVGTSWFFAYGRSRTTRTSALVHLYEPAVVARTEEEESVQLGPDEVPRVVVPVFGHEPAPGRLVRLAAAFADAGALEILRLEEVPHGMDLGHLIPTDDQMARLAKQSRALAADRHLDVEFKDVITHNAQRALRDHARSSRAEWIVMEGPKRQGLRYLVRHPMSWWLDHAPCDLAVFDDRRPPVPEREKSPAADPDALEDGTTLMEVREGFTRLLVLAEPGPYDTMLIHVADSLAKQNMASITLLRVVPTATSDAGIEGQKGYHRELMSLSSSHLKSIVLRSDDHERAITEVSSEYDLLIMGAAAERGWRTLVFGSGTQRIADAAACSVLRLKSPQDRVHHRLPSKADIPTAGFALVPYLEAGALRTGFAAGSKKELFSRIAGTLDIDGDGVSEEAMQASLWRREDRQNTALAGGVALTATVVPGLGTTQLGVFLLDQPVDYASLGRDRVDVVFVVLAPPQERMDQLWLVDRLHEMIRRTTLVKDLRAASDAEGLYSALEAAETAVEALEG